MSEDISRPIEPSNLKSVSPDALGLFKGRKAVYTKYASVDETNVCKVIEDTRSAHMFNRGQIEYLHNYKRGRQPILGRVKQVRPEINNRIVENHAKEIVDFKVGYMLSEPIQYISRAVEETKESVRGGASVLEQDDALAGNIKTLNTLMYAEDKASHDRDLFEWMCECGVGYRMVEADNERDRREVGGAPFELVTLDPRDTYVIRSRGYRHEVLAAVIITKDANDEEMYNVYTDEKYFLVKSGKLAIESDNALPGIPVIEYELNGDRMGCFEAVLPILDAINAVESNRLDGIEQTVQSLMKFVNCDIDESDFAALLELGAIKISTPEGKTADVQFMSNDLDQTQTQVTKDDLYQAMYQIAGMPNTCGTKGSSSDTGTAVLLRDGWTSAETHAKTYELKFKRSEREMLRIVLGICRHAGEDSVDLRIRDIELAFNRRITESTLVKSQTLTTMLANSDIHPLLAYQQCGMFPDPEAAYLLSEAYKEQMRSMRAQDELEGRMGHSEGVDDDLNEHNAEVQRVAMANAIASQTGVHPVA